MEIIEKDFFARLLIHPNKPLQFVKNGEYQIFCEDSELLKKLLQETGNRDWLGFHPGKTILETDGKFYGCIAMQPHKYVFLRELQEI